MIMDKEPKKEHKHDWKLEQHFDEFAGNTKIGHVTYSCACGATATDDDFCVI